MLKITTTLKNTFYEDKEKRDTMIQFYLIKTNHSVIIQHKFVISICLSRVLTILTLSIFSKIIIHTKFKISGYLIFL